MSKVFDLNSGIFASAYTARIASPDRGREVLHGALCLSVYRADCIGKINQKMMQFFGITL